MQYFIKRVTSAVVAGAVVLGSIALYPDAKKNVVNAAETKYDSASLVNYEIILGRATDYGIVSKSFTQNSHMETTLATSSFSRTASCSDSIDVDLTSSPTAQFVIGGVTPADGYIAFGPVKHSDQSIDVKNVNVVFPDSPDFNVTNNVQLRMNVADQTTFNYSYLSKEKIDNNINSVIGHGKDEADKISVKTGNSDYVLDVTEPGVLDVNTNSNLTTIDLSNPVYKNRVVYINISPVKTEPGQPPKDDPFRNLREVFKSDPGGKHLIVKKNSSTVVVFTNDEPGPVGLGKVQVQVVDSDYVDTPPLNAPNDAYCSSTDHSGYMSQHNSFVDREIAQKFIWNIPNSKEVTLTGSAGTFLLNGDDVKVKLKDNPSAGWIVANGNVENGCEFHYIYGGASTEISTEGNGQMHFALHKNFASAYKTKAELENGSSFVDTSIDIEKDQYSFVLQEYTDETFATTYGPAIPRSVGTDSILEFPTISFTADDSGTEHYAVKKDSSGASYKDFYFRVKENPNSVYSIANNAGRIDIRLRVTSNDAGTISFAVQSKTYIGDSEDSLILYAENGTFGSKDKWVDMVGPRFDLGAFYNKVLVPGYMTLSKTISDNVSEEDLKDITFTVTDGKDFSVEYKLGRDFTKNPTTGVYELTTPLTVPDAQTAYTVTETLYSLDGYKLEEVSYKVDGGETQHNNDTASLDSVSTDSNNPTTVAYTDSYTPLGTLKVHKTAVDNNNKNINYYYEFSVKNSAGLFLQADKQTFDTTEYYFTIGTNEEQVFENIPVGIYTITEKTDGLFVYGYTFEKEISKISGTADVTKKSTGDFTLENKFTQDLGNLKVTKAAEDNNGNVVEGTFKFTISTPMRGFLQADGSFGNSKHFFTIRTGQTLTFENLPVDNYMITEDTDSINVTGYTFNMADSKYSVLGKVTKNGNTNVILENDFTQDVGTLKVIKTAKDNHDTNVSGTFEFSVMNSKGQYLQADKKSFDTTKVFFTVEAGSFTAFENIPVGSYTVEENTGSISVDGFTFTTEGSTTSVVADVKKNETADAGLFNNFIQDLGTLTVAKVATDDNDKNVNGSFQFSVKNSAGKFLQSDEETFTNTEYFFTVEAGSSKTFTDLPVGEYTISEKTNGVSVPGYTYLVNDSTTKGTGTVSKVTTANSTVTLENKFEQDVGSLTVSKTAKDDNNENVSGSFKFTVKNSAGLYLQSDKKTFDTEVYFFTVAAGSTAVFNNLPVGVYTVTEDANSVAVTGYTFISSRIPEVEAEVEKNESVTAELVNNYEKDVGNLVVSKTAKDNNDKSVAGSFKFSVKNSAGLYLQSDKKTFDTAEYFFTVASGSTAEFNNLPVGVYTVTEDPDSVGVTGYTFESGSTTHVEAEVVKNDSVTAGLVNNYTQDTGSLTVKKSAIDNYDNTVNGTFKFSVKNSDDKFLQEDEKSFEDEAFFFTVAAGSSKTFENLPVGTYSVNEDTGSVSVTGYTFNENDSKTYAEARVVKDGNADAELENKFTLDLGSLKITKALGEGYPEEARTKAYNFIINGPDDYSEMRTVTGADSVIITGLKPGKYTVTEDTNDAKIKGYDLEVTGGGEVTVVGKAEAATTITNTYTLQTGSLKITKALGDNAPEEAALKTYSFTITGPNNYSKTVSVDGAGYVIVEDLVPGTYTVTENTEGAAIEGYDLEVTGGGEVNVVAKATALTTVTNTYKLQLGSLKITKELGANAPESAARKSYTFVITGPDNYSKEVAIIGADSETVENLVPGTYTVAEVEDGAVIADYDLEVTGGGEVTVAAKATAETKVTNTYTKQTGSLTVSKIATDNNGDDVNETFYFSVKNSEGQYLQNDRKSFGASEVFFEVTAGGTEEFTDLPVGVYTISEDTTRVEVTGYDFLTTSTTKTTARVTKSTTAATATLENNYEKHLGSLTVQKNALDNNNEDVDGTFEFSVKNGEGKYLQRDEQTFADTVFFFTVDAGASKTFENLPAGKYNVEENTANISVTGYTFDLDESTTIGTGTVSKTSSEHSTVTLENKFTKDVGSLKITKALGANAPESAKSKSYSFTITGPDNYSKEVAVIGEGSVTVENLVPGTYTVTENETGAAITGYDLEVTGGGEVTVVAKATAETTVTNTYTQQKGSLKITKTLGANAPAAASNTEYKFTITGPDNYSKTVTIKGADSVTIDDLEPGNYTVTEDKDGAKIDNYELTVTGDDGKTIEVKAGETANAAITNTYEDNTSSTKGSLKITKKLGANAPQAASSKEYKFTVTGPDNYSKTVTIKGADSVTIDDLEPGNYTVTEDKDGAKIDNYELTVTGDDGKTIEVKAGETADVAITNTYEDNTSSTKGSLKITKTLGANAPQAASSKEYKFTVTGPDNYSKTVTIKGADSVTIDDLEPGNYTVTEDKDGAKIANYELEVTGDDGKAIEVKAGETAEAEITNTYDDNTMSDKGSLKISKTLGANAPSAASDKSFTFTVTGPDNYTKTVTIKGTGSVTIDDLEPGNYTVTEDEEGAAITDYKLTVTGDNGNAIEVKAGKTANAAITNTYKDSTLSEVGSLKITKALGSGAPSAASNKEFKFTVTGPDNYSKTVTIKGAGSYTIRDLTPGSYKVTEDKASANIENYDLEVTGGGTVEVKAGQTAESTVTNTYKDNSTTVDTGSLTVSKLALDMSEDPITGSFKFSVKNSEGKYLQQNEKDFGTSIYLFTINGGESKKFTGLPVGSYTVEEDISDMSVEGNCVLVVDQSATSVFDNVTKNGDTEFKLINMFEEGGVPTPAPTGAVTVTKKVAGDASVAASSYKFYVKCGDQYVQDDSTGALGSDKHAFTVDPSSSEGTTITGLTLGKTYVIEEESVSAPSGYTCAVTYTESNTVVLDKENKTGSVKITNTYIDTSKPDDSGNETGSLKVTKKVTGSTASSGMPSEYKFTVSYIDGDETLYVQDTAGATGSEKHEFTVSADSSVVIKGLALDVEYKVEEVKVTGIPSDYSCKTSYSDGGTITLDSSSATGTVVITNNYSYKAPEPEPTTGSLTITKGLNSGAPSAAKNKTYTFKVTGNGETRTVTIKGANSKTIHDLVPGTYTVSEERDGISINKYSVSVSGEGNVTIEAGKTAKIKITNTYDDITGSLKITKALASGAPDAAQNKTYKFTVTGPDDYSETVEIKGAGSKTLTGLMPGKYTVTENESAAAIDGYNLTVTGDNVSKNVETKGVAYVTITNAYEQKMGTLCFTKTFGGDVTESEANGGDLYFIIENTDTSIEARYLKPDGTFTADKSEAHITLAHLEKTTATNGKFAFKKNFTVPVGNYKVTEENTNVYFRGTSEPITMANSSVTSSVADITDGNTTDVELSDVYELNDNLKVTFNKEDEAHNLIAQAQLTLKSVDGYDLSNVKVTQGGTQVAVTLSADKSSISFYTVDTAPSIVSGLKAGDYELTETVTPPKYKTADAIRFTLYPDGNTKRVGDVTVSGSPIVMIDKADPNYHQGGNNPPIPATGEMTSATTMIGAALMVLAAACFTGLYIFRTKKKEEN